MDYLPIAIINGVYEVFEVQQQKLILDYILFSEKFIIKSDVYSFQLAILSKSFSNELSKAMSYANNSENVFNSIEQTD